MDDIKIRKADRGDLEDLYQCFQVFYKPEEKWSREILKEKIGRKNYHVAELNGEVLGVIQIGADEVGSVCEIENLAVKKEAQGKGIGKKLVEFAENYAKEHRCHKTWLFTLDWYHAAPFYEKLGYEQEGFLKNHWHKMGCYIFGKQL